MTLKKNSGYIKLLADYDSTYIKGIIDGVSQALRHRPLWITRLRHTSFDWECLIDRWKPDCIIASMLNQRMVDLLARAGIPAVNISGALEEVPFPTIISDGFAVGRMGAEYLMELNLEHFAFWGSHSGFFAQRRQDGFTDTLISAGIPEKNIHFCRHDMFMDIDKREKELRDWLMSLPRPVGLLASHDGRAYYLNDIARSVGIDIPNEIALLGVDNDKQMCEISRPSLSSISLPLENIGIKAVEILEKIMRGESVPDKILLPPCEVISRASTEMLAIEDPDIAKAVMYIRSHATEDINISDLLRHVVLSRRTLENKFNACFKRTPGAEIRRVRTEHAKKLLLNSDMSILDIAIRSGFNSPEYMSRIFLKRHGVTPSQYRREHRPHY